MLNIAAEIPPSLRDADDILTKYGRWAMQRRRIHRCGSAEGQYRAPANDDDRQPRELMMPTLDAIAAQRALAKVPDLYRIVLAVLYVPQRLPAQVQLRILGIPARLSQERHLAGLRMFDTIYHACYRMRAPESVSAPRIA